ncbi:MAG: hypothetical protein VXW87_03220, partial [Pseudomonadota bacterium]|nr:hypothetical protein [Pseudomonadota bacterium]
EGCGSDRLKELFNQVLQETNSLDVYHQLAVSASKDSRYESKSVEELTAAFKQDLQGMYAASRLAELVESDKGLTFQVQPQNLNGLQLFLVTLLSIITLGIYPIVVGSIHLAKGNKGEVNWPGVSIEPNVMPQREAQVTNVRDAWDAILGQTKTFSAREGERVEMFRSYAAASQRLLEEQVLKEQLSLVIFPQPKGQKSAQNMKRKVGIGRPSFSGAGSDGGDKRGPRSRITSR